MEALALDGDVLLETKDHVGPISLLRGDDFEKNLELSAAITLRYSDAPKNTAEIVLFQKKETKSELSVSQIAESEYLQYRI